MTEEEILINIKEMINICDSLPSEECTAHIISHDHFNAVKGLLDLYKKEKEKNRKIKESLAFRVGKSREKANHTMEYEKLNKNNKFGHNGICEDKRHKRKKYRAYINLRYKQISLGTYDNLEDAIKAREDGEKAIKKILEE